MSFESLKLFRNSSRNKLNALLDPASKYEPGHVVEGRCVLVLNDPLKAKQVVLHIYGNEAAEYVVEQELVHLTKSVAVPDEDFHVTVHINNQSSYNVTKMEYTFLKAIKFKPQHCLFPNIPVQTTVLERSTECSDVEMPRGPALTKYEKGQIDALRAEDISYREIERRLNRSEHVIRHYCTDPDAYNINRHNAGRHPVLSQKDKRQIPREASNSEKNGEK
uniref:Tc3 transposase DNA binding domain-containing protein n=1 Tax=Ditylenchus dipsaci TaxID=166011 RepID=A0A915E1A3_9BILA